MLGLNRGLITEIIRISIGPSGATEEDRRIRSVVLKAAGGVAEAIEKNNRKIEEQLRGAGIKI
jgi:hypothetical protein